MKTKWKSDAVSTRKRRITRVRPRKNSAKNEKKKRKEYITGTLIIKAVGVDQNNGGTFVSGLHTYQGVYAPFKGRKTHNDVQFTANIVGQPTGYYVIFNKWYEPDLFKKHGEWETGQRLVPFE